MSLLATIFPMVVVFAVFTFWVVVVCLLMVVLFIVFVHGIVVVCLGREGNSILLTPESQEFPKKGQSELPFAPCNFQIMKLLDWFVDVDDLFHQDCISDTGGLGNHMFRNGVRGVVIRGTHCCGRGLVGVIVGVLIVMA